jgi:prolyl-tRNA synthetase
VVTPAPAEQSIEDKPDAQVHHTPNTPTIESLVDFLNGVDFSGQEPDRRFTAADTLKNVLLKTRMPGQKEWTLLGVGLPGDREVDMKRIEASLEPAEVALLEEKDFAANPFLVKGYIGPGALAANGVRYLVDPRIVRGTAWVTGADKADHHVVDLVCGRDFTPDGTIEAAEVREGDPAPDGTGTLVAARGIEIGHIFQLGRKYADAFSLDALGPDSKPIRITMGSYGIGVSRAVAVIAEQYNDERGLVWPRNVSPFDLHIVMAGKDDSIREYAEKLAGELDAAGVTVLLDDRKASPGVKFADAELIGVPTIVVVGRGLANGVVEVKDRASGERTEVAVDEVVEHLRALVTS